MAEPQWERTAKTKMGIYLTSIETAFILKSVDFDHKTIADLGSGGGKFSILALRKSAYVISLDRDLGSLKWLKSRDHSSNVILGDVTALPLRENTVDILFLIEIFDYVTETKTLLREMYRILKEQGSLILSFGNTSSLKSRLRRLRKKYYVQDAYSYGEAVQLLNRFNFRIIQEEGYNWLLLNRESNNKFIPFFGKIVRLLRLDKLSVISPWIIVCASKC
ncbi:MAG: class I SAM-dependent methyltransferase [Candidatus Bathyarchaeia archaeon]